MRHYAITAVRVDRLGRISHAVLDEVDKNGAERPPWWNGNPLELEASDIAYLIATGNVVEAVFIENSQPNFGPRMLRVKYEDGREGIELAQETIGRTYRDLIQLGE